MGTTRIKVIDLSSEQAEIKTARKHARLAAKRAGKLSGLGKLKTEKKPATGKSTEKKHEDTLSVQTASVPSAPSVPSVITKQSAISTTARKHQHHIGKKYQQAARHIDKNKAYPIKEAIELLHQASYTKFDPTVEIHLNVTDKNIKGSVNLPHPVGKKKEKKYLVFSDKRSPINDKRIIWGDTKTIDDIQNGKLSPNRDFDAVIAEPKFMPQLAKVAKILGPRGMMPNPKDKTIVDNPQEAIQKQANSNSLQYATDPTAPIIHSTLGKLSAKPEQLEKNFQAYVAAIGPTKISKATVKSTMSPPVKVDISSLTSLQG
ncbi:hypothetical protein HYU92_06645 [Candidatus Curtissbacteria bacterium]|nr:hypothetical protein [Candidatus Curtissbacteria bacterium]